MRELIFKHLDDALEAVNYLTKMTGLYFTLSEDKTPRDVRWVVTVSRLP